MTIEVIVGDITKQMVDVVVNAANSALCGGGGVDGAIHRAAGPALLAECRTLQRCPAGEVRITKAYQLPAKHIIHAVGPVWRGGDAAEANALAACYRNAFTLAAEQGASSIAFPAISCGAYGYPMADAARTAVTTIRQCLDQGPSMRVLLISFDERMAKVLRNAL